MNEAENKKSRNAEKAAIFLTGANAAMHRDNERMERFAEDYNFDKIVKDNKSKKSEKIATPLNNSDEMSDYYNYQALEREINDTEDKAFSDRGKTATQTLFFNKPTVTGVKDSSLKNLHLAILNLNSITYNNDKGCGDSRHYEEKKNLKCIFPISDKEI